MHIIKHVGIFYDHERWLIYINFGRAPSLSRANFLAEKIGRVISWRSSLGSGGSRIAQIFGGKTYYLAKFFPPKTA